MNYSNISLVRHVYDLANARFGDAVGGWVFSPRSFSWIVLINSLLRSCYVEYYTNSTPVYIATCLRYEMDFKYVLARDTAVLLPIMMIILVGGNVRSDAFTLPSRVLISSLRNSSLMWACSGCLILYSDVTGYDWGLRVLFRMIF